MKLANQPPVGKLLVDFKLKGLLVLTAVLISGVRPQSEH